MGNTEGKRHGPGSSQQEPPLLRLPYTQEYTSKIEEEFEEEDAEVDVVEDEEASGQELTIAPLVLVLWHWWLMLQMCEN